MLKVLGLCISFLVIGITVGTPTKDIEELFNHLEELRLNHYAKNSDEPYDHINMAHPVRNFRDNSNNINDGYDGEIVLRNLDELERTLAHAYRMYNLERRMNNLLNAHHHLPIAQQFSSQPKESVQNLAYSQESAINQHQLKRAIDPIGGANLLKRAVDRIGGGNLLKRR